MSDIDFEKAVIERLTRIETKLNNGINKVQEDHEKRIRFLERGLWIAVGVFTLAQIIINIIK